MVRLTIGIWTTQHFFNSSSKRIDCAAIHYQLLGNAAVFNIRNAEAGGNNQTSTCLQHIYRYTRFCPILCAHRDFQFLQSMKRLNVHNPTIHTDTSTATIYTLKQTISKAHPAPHKMPPDHLPRHISIVVSSPTQFKRPSLHIHCQFNKLIFYKEQNGGCGPRNTFHYSTVFPEPTKFCLQQSMTCPESKNFSGLCVVVGTKWRLDTLQLECHSNALS